MLDRVELTSDVPAPCTLLMVYKHAKYEYLMSSEKKTSRIADSEKKPRNMFLTLTHRDDEYGINMYGFFDP